MSNSFGEFLKQKRQEKNLTQKELAKLLYVSESAVSKWEKNVAHPDIMLLPKLSELLDVTEHEIITAGVDTRSREEKMQAKKWRRLSVAFDLFFTISYIVTIITCFICNIATIGKLTWFWIVFSALVLSFNFINLPRLIKKQKLLIIPASIYLSLCLLFYVCCVYTNGDWFWIVSFSVFLAFVIIFLPIYISKLSFFDKINKYNNFISMAVIFVVLNILLILIDSYCVTNCYSNEHWYVKIALPLVCVVYLILNLFMCVKFLNINNLLKTSLILFMISLLYCVVPHVLKFQNSNIKKEIESINIFKADFSKWDVEIVLERNIHCIIFLTLLGLSIVFFVFGLIKYINNRNHNKN